jgi:hypothetical protein
MGLEEERHTVSRMPIPANTAVAGENGYRMAIRNRLLG